MTDKLAICPAQRVVRPAWRSGAGLLAWALLGWMLLALAGCGSPGPRTGTADRLPGHWPERSPERSPDRDGPGANPPPDLHLVPDAEPRIEPLRQGGPNKPYELLGRRYLPLQGDVVLRERGLASWYGRKFHGRPTANGEVYDMYAMTAAHKTMPLPSYARVRNPANGREVVVRVNDRGPFHDDRVIDLSYTAALRLGLLAGVAPVEVERITHDQIRAGLWRIPPAAGPADARQPPAARPAVATMPEPEGSVADPIAEFARPTAAAPAQPGPAVPAELPALASAAAADAERATRATAAAPPGARPAPGTGFWLQLGAFRDPAGAAALQQRLQREADWLAPLLGIVSDRAWHRLQAGPYASREDALGAARRLHEWLQMPAALVERR